MKVKLSVVICVWVKTRDAVLDSQDPDTLIRLGTRFTKSWTVCVWKLKVGLFSLDACDVLFYCEVLMLPCSETWRRRRR